MIDIASAIKKLRARIDATTKPGYLPYEIEVIKKAIIDCGYVDEINICEVSIEIKNRMSNPVKGCFERYRQPQAVYDHNPRDIVNIHFQSSLNYCWRRFVVCKEMCHSFIDDKDSWVKDESALIELADWLRLPPEHKESLHSFAQSIQSEKIAEVVALELLCPVQLRKQVAEKRKEQHISDRTIATEFRVPTVFVDLIFRQNYIERVGKVLL